MFYSHTLLRKEPSIQFSVLFTKTFSRILQTIWSLIMELANEIKKKIVSAFHLDCNLLEYFLQAIFYLYSVAQFLSILVLLVNLLYLIFIASSIVFEY